MPNPKSRAWSHFDGDRAPAAVALLASCSCGWTGEHVQTIDRLRTIEANEREVREEWNAHAVAAATAPAESVVTDLDLILERLTADDPRAALTIAAVLERRARTVIAAAGEAARAQGDSWVLLGGALGVTRQSAYERLRPRSRQAR
ncbi:hypothetical protein [Streptomyces sp. NPDC057910]|uniref:hypothetical protein n=1 Tax=Streptomyces sp. NPDC057910 TaxID=3346278 RepID=UPI0036EE8A9D